MKDEEKKPTSRAKKEQIVAKLVEKVGKAKAVVFTNYQGLTHKQLEQLKKALKATEAELVIAKNTLLKFALEKSEIPALPARFAESRRAGRRNPKSETPNLNGPTATLFAYNDIFAPLKELAKTIKLLKLPSVKFGLVKQDITWQLLSDIDISRMATLPSREVLLSQLVGVMKSPIYGLHRALNWNIQKFVLTLKAIEAKKE